MEKYCGISLKYMYIIIFLVKCLDILIGTHTFASSFTYNEEVNLLIEFMGNDRESEVKYPFIVRKRINYY